MSKSVDDPLATLGEPVESACFRVLTDYKNLPVIFEEAVPLVAAPDNPAIARNGTRLISVTHTFSLGPSNIPSQLPASCHRYS